MTPRKLTLLHSNDLHGDFLPQAEPPYGKLSGGLAYLSGYVKSVRRSQPDTLFIFAGDMIQGSVIDSEWKGISTIELMNCLAPDIACLGNHELDYGLRHLLFLEKLANFPIVSANLYIKNTNKRLMRPFELLQAAGLKIMFIGIITEEALDALKTDREVSAFITIEDAAEEVRRICNAYRTVDIDLTILLTHIGLEDDRRLASLLDASLGVDMIIGGHSHTKLAAPLVVNQILIAQSGTGSDQIGRFDLVIDDRTNQIVEWNWQLVPITPELAPPDEDLERMVIRYATQAATKNNTILTHFIDRLTHPTRSAETALGNLIADILANWAGADIALVGSGSIRWQSLGPQVTLGDFQACFPFRQGLYQHTVSGSLIQQLFAHFMSPGQRLSGHGEYFQVNQRVHAEYSDREERLVRLDLDGQPVAAERTYTLLTDEYHYMNALTSFGFSPETLSENGGPRLISASIQDILREYLQGHQNLNRQVESRLVQL
jgi:5'-nucleotidase / UDP-sugar diphosphatase